jgi:arylsulfatase A-like enzyme
LNIDIAPTILELAGAETPDTFDGQSFLDMLSGTEVNWRSDFLIENWNDQPYADPFVGLHEGDWSYVHFDSGAEELYNLVNDPYQLDNVASDSQYADRISSMRDRTITLMQCSGADQCQ